MIVDVGPDVVIPKGWVPSRYGCPVMWEFFLKEGDIVQCGVEALCTVSLPPVLIVKPIRWRAGFMENYVSVGVSGNIVTVVEAFSPADKFNWDHCNYFAIREEAECAAKVVRALLKLQSKDKQPGDNKKAIRALKEGRGQRECDHIGFAAVRRGRARWVCGNCGKDITGVLVALDEAETGEKNGG